MARRVTDEMVVPAPLLSALFTGVLDLEARLARRWPLPVGLSVLVLAQKPAAGAGAPAGSAATSLAMAS